MPLTWPLRLRNLSQPVERAAGMPGGQVPRPPHRLQTQPPPCLFLSSPRNFQKVTTFPGHQSCSFEALTVLSHPSGLSSAELSQPPLVPPEWQPGSHAFFCFCPRRWQRLAPRPLGLLFSSGHLHSSGPPPSCTLALPLTLAAPLLKSPDQTILFSSVQGSANSAVG